MKLTYLCLVFSLVLFQILVTTSNYVVSANEDDDADDHHEDAIANDNKSTPKSADESSPKVMSSSDKTPKKIRRTIRVRESAPTTNESPSGDVQARNGALTNNVEVKPDISIQMPQSSKSNVHPDKELPQNIRSRNSRLNKVPYKPRYTPRNKQIVPFQPQRQPTDYNPKPLIEEVKDDGNQANSLAMMPYAEEKQQAYKVEEESPLERDNISGNEIVNSDNQVYNSMSNSGNNKNVMMNNIGNSETVLIDGVGNNKLTKVSNVGNSEQHEHENGSNNNVNHETPPHYSDTNKQPDLQQHHHHHHHHYHNEPVHEVKSSSVDMQEKPFVQININGNEYEKHKVSAASPETPLGASSVLVPLTNGASLYDMVKLSQLNQVESPLESNSNNTSVLSEILKPTSLKSSGQPLILGQNPLQSNYMVVQQAPSLGQGLIGTPLVVAQAKPQIVAQAQQMISPAAATTTLVDPMMSASFLQQQINKQQQLQHQLGQQQRFQQQQLQQLMSMMSMMSMMMRSQYPPSATTVWPQYAQMWPPMNGFRPQMHGNKKEGDKKGMSRRERRRERRERRRKRRREEEEEAEADSDLEDYDEEEGDEKKEAEKKKEKKVKVKKSKANGKEKQPEEQPKSMLSRMVSGFGLPDALRPSTSILDGAVAKVPDTLSEGQSVKKD